MVRATLAHRGSAPQKTGRANASREIEALSQVFRDARTAADYACSKRDPMGAVTGNVSVYKRFPSLRAWLRAREDAGFLSQHGMISNPFIPLGWVISGWRFLQRTSDQQRAVHCK